MAEETSQSQTPDAKKAAEVFRKFHHESREIAHDFRSKAEMLISKIDEKHAEEIKKRIASS